jgi:hypothetical protein
MENLSCQKICGKVQVNSQKIWKTKKVEYIGPSFGKVQNFSIKLNWGILVVKKANQSELITSELTAEGFI